MARQSGPHQVCSYVRDGGRDPFSEPQMSRRITDSFRLRFRSTTLYSSSTQVKVVEKVGRGNEAAEAQPRDQGHSHAN